ncbi:MAG: aminotransferase class III-fold pyridoxal phosphate-dependent enzyme [Armatimonadota bacterium]
MRVNSNWTFVEVDQKIAEEMRSLMPERIFDTHAHIYRIRDLQLSGSNIITQGPDVADIELWKKHIGMQVGKSKLVGGLFMGYPCIKDLNEANQFTISQASSAKDNSKALLVVSPDSSQDEIAKLCELPVVRGFKPYHTMSKHTPTYNAQVGEYLPEWIWRVANDRGMVIMLHLVRYAALSDKGNLDCIRRMCEKYPDARLVLAHCGRGFCACNTINGISTLKGLENVWFDTSGICEAEAIMAVLEEFGPRRLLWGSDFPISEQRGKFVTVGDGFAFITPESADESDSSFCRPALTGLESLRALVNAAHSFGLNKTDLQDIFCDNALALLSINESDTTLSQQLYTHAKKRIPGGVQLLSKRPEMMAPDQWPPYSGQARGCEVWDIDGRHYYDMSTNGIGSCLLGFRDPDVTQAVRRRINLGSMSSLNPPEEVELADTLCKIHPWAEQVRFGRSGGEAAAIAVRIARATTDRSVVTICGYHGWHDWYLAANLAENDSLRGHLLAGLDPLGVPRELRGTAFTFKYNDRAALQAILDQHGEKLAAIIMEPCRYNNPEPGFLEFVRDSAHKCGALLIFDEITIGWRLHFGGAHLKLGVNPDIAVFAKALGNGHPVAAIIGSAEAMSGAQSSFISSTYWTESVGPAAALATIGKMKSANVVENVARVGSLISDSWNRHAATTGLPVVAGDGYPCLAHFRFEHKQSAELRTLYTQLMLDRSFLAGCSIYPTLAHTDDVIELYDKAVGEVFEEISQALDSNTVREKLRGQPAHSGFQRLL